MKKKSIHKIIVREFKRIRERKTLFLLEIIFPIILFFLFSEIYKEELIREMPIAIYDADNSSLSRTISQFIDSSPTLKITESLNSIDEVKNEFIKGRIKGAFVIPRNLEKDVKSGQSSSVIVYKNSSNILVGNYILKESAAIIKTVSGGALLKKLRSSGLTNEKAMAVVNPIQIETASLYNPNYSYENYLMPGLVTFTLQMMVMLAAVIVISSEYSHQSFNELVNLAGNSAHKLLIGKSIPHLLIHFASVTLILGIIFPLYNITIHGSFFTVFALMVIFIFASFFLGLLISAIINDQLLATEIAVFINTPAFIFSGFTFPIWGMPFIHTIFAQILPYTHFLKAFLKVYQMGASFSDITNEIIVLSLFGIVSIIGILITLKIKMRNHNEKMALAFEVE